MSKSLRNVLLFTCIFSFITVFYTNSAFGMHIMEGFLPVKWSVIWSIVSLPFIIVSFNSIKKKVEDNPNLKILLAMVGAFAFVLSSIKMPSVTGSSSHATGIGLGAILFGPSAMAVIGLIVLLFQALLLAHGGLTTLGANVFSMAIAGPFMAYVVYKGIKKIGGATAIAVFFGAMLGDLFTYMITSIELALAFPAAAGGIMFSFTKFMGVFAITQIPLAIVEGLLTVLVFNLIVKNSGSELASLNIHLDNHSIRKSPWSTVLIAIFIVFLIFVPYVIYGNMDMSGSDDNAGETIGEISESYVPWFNSIFEPSSDNMEVALFLVQTGLGGLVLGFAAGRITRKKVR